MALPRVPGTHTLDVRATAPDAAVTTGNRLSWSVAAPKATFTVKVTDVGKKRGSKTTVSASKLLPGEKYTIRISGRVVATGRASLSGTVSRSVTIPKAGQVSER